GGGHSGAEYDRAQVGIGAADRMAPADKQIGFARDGVRGRSTNIEEVHAADPIVVQILVFGKVVRKQPIDEINSVMTVKPNGRTLNRQVMRNQITELKLPVAALRSDIRNLLHHAECVSSLRESLPANLSA